MCTPKGLLSHSSRLGLLEAQDTLSRKMGPKPSPNERSRSTTEPTSANKINNYEENDAALDIKPPCVCLISGYLQEA